MKEEAARPFKAWRGGDDAVLPPYLRRVVFGIVLGEEDASPEDYEAVFETYKTAPSADGKELALASLGDVTDPQLIKKTLDLILSGEIVPQDIHSPCTSLAHNRKTKVLWWETMKEHWT